MCDLDRRTFLKAVPGAALLAGELLYGARAHAQARTDAHSRSRVWERR
jgi:hypothetical protein